MTGDVGRVAGSILLCFLVGAGIGCAEDTDQAPVAVDTSLPHLEQIVIPALDSIGPERPNAMFAVSASGRMAFTTGYDPDEKLITVVDTNGSVLHRMARRGSGPGELESAFYAFMEYYEDTLLVLTPSAQLYKFSPSGEFVGSSSRIDAISASGGMPLRIAGDSADFMVIGMELRLSIPEITRVSTRSGAGRTLLSATDGRHDSLRAAFPWALKLTGLLATTEDLTVVGDAFNYRFQSFDRDGNPLRQWGREMPQRFNPESFIDSALAVRSKLGRPHPQTGVMRFPSASEIQSMEASLRKPLPLISMLEFDAGGRLWAFGRDSTGSTFGDIFADTTWLGRVELGCDIGANAPSMSGDFLLLLCIDNTRDSGAQLKLFRMRRGN